MVARADNLLDRRVLVVDDWPEMASLVSEALDGAGAHAESVTDGREAMRRLAAGGYDLLILDLGMPHPDGWDILEFIHQAVPDVLARTIVLTGRRYDDETTNRLTAEQLVVLYKPFSLDTLLDLAAQALGRYRAA